MYEIKMMVKIRVNIKSAQQIIHQLNEFEDVWLQKLILVVSF